MGFDTLIRDLQDTKDQLGPSDTFSPVFKRFNETVNVLPPVLKIEKQSIGNAFTVGDPNNGIIGTANGVNGSQITIGVAGLGSLSTQRITSSRNTFTDLLRNTDYVNTTNTDATVNTSTFKIEFGNTGADFTFTATFPMTFDVEDAVFESSSIAYNDGTIVNAKLIIDENFITGTPASYQMSADGGSNWETVTLNTKHEFTNTGTDLRYRITAPSGVEIAVRNANGVDSPIKVEYNKG